VSAWHDVVINNGDRKMANLILISIFVVPALLQVKNALIRKPAKVKARR
jgi:hypothetical protein